MGRTIHKDRRGGVDIVAEEFTHVATETAEDRRARLGEPREIGTFSWRRFGVAVAVLVVLLAGIFFGIVPGSSAVGRYPVWELHALAERIRAAPNYADCGFDPPDEVYVDLLTGRVVAVGGYVDLSEDELAMVTRTWSSGPFLPKVRATRVSLGAPSLCVTAA